MESAVDATEFEDIANKTATSGQSIACMMLDSIVGGKYLFNLSQSLPEH